MIAALMEKMSTVLIVVGLALIDEQGRVLMQKRPQDKAHGGLWEFPGGKVDPGESCELALVRETDEELGIAVDVSDLTAVSFSTGDLGNSTRQLLLLLYATHKWTGVPRAVEAGSSIAWVDPATLSGLAMPPLDIPLAHALIRYLEGVAKEESDP